MNYLKFDKLLLTNLEKSRSKEVLRTNSLGGYSSTTIINCNTRKYHGLLVAPAPALDNDNHVFIAACDETIIQHGAEFNLAVREYQGNYFSPRGHKYIREFHADGVATTIYRVGGVILKKERLLVQEENRVLLSYELLEAHSPTTLRLKPFLAFRSVHALTHENPHINTGYSEVQNGVSFCLYEGYPSLVMQTNRQNKFVSHNDWYRDIEYYKEQERGYECREDLFVPGYFEMPIKRGEVIVFSAGLSPLPAIQIKRLFDAEKARTEVRSDFFSCLKVAARQFYVTQKDGYYLLAGYPWFQYRARDAFIALPGATLAIGDVDMFEKMMLIGSRAVDDFITASPKSTRLKEVSAPDVLLWYIWAIQQYALATTFAQAAQNYGQQILDVLAFIKKQQHPNLFMHRNGLLYTNGTQKPATWMNAIEDDRPITPRTGYIVEINALWYNVLKFGASIAEALGQNNQAALLDYQAGGAAQSFVEYFWNGAYLYDFIDGDYRNPEVRPNMIFAISLPYSPLNKTQQKATLDIITRELLTIKGLRTLSPKSSMYRPNYVGGVSERNHNYHNGPVWPWTTAAFIEAYLRIYKTSGISFVNRLLAGFESELTELTVGTLSEIYDGNPPFKGHGAMSYAMTVAELLRAIHISKHFVEQ
ncbi:MAG: amylo-alpha-1,6-glucosidase [Prevotellaceae bacterium]|nr:amylo-alpha-1,6-glucosidase [Prevotellaceae bacterium]